MELIDANELLKHEAPAKSYSPEMLVIGKGYVLHARRYPEDGSRVEQGMLLAARWLIEYGLPSVAAHMLRDHGLDGCDLRKMEEQDIEILATLNATEGTHFILPNTEASRGA